MITRRRFLESTGAVALGFFGLRELLTRDALAKTVGYGPLVPDEKKILDLPRGFSYRIISRRGDAMSDGYRVPGQPDGMATFPGPRGTTILIRNHEMMPGKNPFGDVIPQRVYDAGHNVTPGRGGTTTVVYDTKKQRIETQFLSLAGTIRNCAGGPTPWGSWISSICIIGRTTRGQDSVLPGEGGS